MPKFIGYSLRSEFEKMREDLLKLTSHVERLLKEKAILLKEREVTEEVVGKWISDRIKSPFERGN